MTACFNSVHVVPGHAPASRHISQILSLRDPEALRFSYHSPIVTLKCFTNNCNVSINIRFHEVMIDRGQTGNIFDKS